MKAPMIIESAVAKGKTGQTIDVHVRDLHVSSCAIKMGSKRIHFIAHTTFMAGVNLKKINPGKALHVVPKMK